jgi:hypothetical protein
MRRLASVLATYAALIGCSENGLGSVIGDDLGLDPDIVVEPAQVEFGTLRSDEEATEILTIRNVGEDVLHLDGVEIDGASFTLIGDADLPDRLEPEEGAAFQVRFSPMGANQQLGAVFVTSDDPDSPRLSVPLSGDGAVPELRITPADHDFGTLFVGCEGDVALELENVGVEDLTVDAISLVDDAGAYALTDTNTVPFVLGPGARTGVSVSFVPGAAGAATARVEVASNDPRGVVAANQAGEARYGAIASDTFQMPSDPPVDILFAVDQSCSMDAHAANLGSNFQTFIQEIQTVTANWRVGVVTLDTGCFNDTVFASSTPNLVQRFTSAVAVGGDGTPYTEALFRLSQIALGNTTPGRCNGSFLRPDALLHVVLVSDEYEQSGISPGTYVTSVWGYKAAPSLVKVSGIICPAGGCPNDSGTASGYADAVSITGGVRLDIMTTNWGASARALAEASVAGIGRFELSQYADADSIIVTVDGAAWTTGWRFDPVSNELVFDTLPPVGATIDVDYGVLVRCP